MSEGRSRTVVIVSLLLIAAGLAMALTGVTWKTGTLGIAFLFLGIGVLVGIGLGASP
jgi:hypothetical protein